MIGLMHLSASVYSQSTKLTLEMRNKKVVEVLEEIEKQSEFRFAYSSELIDMNRKVTIDLNNRNIEETLQVLFDGTGVTHVLHDRHIMLYPKEMDADSQQSSVSGKVTDEDGEPLPGVTVVIKGSTKGTVTNMDGDYTISSVAADEVLIFSFVGMVTQEVAVANQAAINITLVVDAIGIEEVVAVGYATQKKVNLTGSVGTVDMDVMESRPVTSAAQMLQGVVPGLNITQSGGTGMDATPSINIRGVATIGEGSTGSPLILIDGMEGDINAINPQDIENISVLKDAAASSIYGSRAPFGVILVTTKSGKVGKTQINYNNNFRLNSPINMPDMMNSMDFATYFNDAGTNAGQSVTFSDERLERIQSYMDGTLDASTTIDERNGYKWNPGYRDGNDNVDWYDALYRDQVLAQEHNISISGGSEKLKFYGSGNYLDQNGFMEFNQDKFNRYSTTLKLSGELTDNLTVNLSSRFVREDYERPTQLTSSMFQDLARQGWPVLPLYDPNGFLFDSPSPALGLRDGGDDVSQTDWLYQQGQLVFEPIKGWKIMGDFNYRTKNKLTHYDQLTTYNHDIYGNAYASDKTTGVYEYSFRENYFSSNVYTEYTKNLKSGHNFKGMVGFQAELNKRRNFSAYRQGIIVSSLTSLDVTSGTDSDGNVVSPEVSGLYKNWSTTGYFGRLNYNYKEKYLLEVNMRYDGTSRFREDKRWEMFPSFSAGWNMANEDFWGGLEDVISVMKIRASYGELGNQNTSDWYPTYQIMDVGASDGSWLVNGAQPNTATAPELVSQYLTWERIRSWNLGLDFRMFDNRLSSSFDYYTRYTDDMVGPAIELPLTLGTDVPDMNNTDLKTYGFELDLTWNDRLSNGLAYSVKFLLSDSQTKITRYPNPTGTLELSDFDDPDVYRAGQMVGEIWGYETIGIAKTDDEMDTYLSTLTNGGQDAIGSQFAAGDIMYKDLNGDGKVDNGSGTIDDHGDLKIIGNNTARYNFAFDLSANYKGFDFRAFFQGVMKRDYFQNSYYFWGATNNKWWSTGFEEHKDYFRADASHRMGENLDSYYARPLFGSTAYKNQKTQSRYIQNAAYVRLKNVQLGYSLPSAWVNKMKLSKVRVFVSGENLFTLTPMSSIFDPETIGGGWGGNVYPLSKVYAMGLSVNF
jgi:TonB-linked SusC/RagA family outer membrane protein